MVKLMSHAAPLLRRGGGHGGRRRPRSQDGAVQLATRLAWRHQTALEMVLRTAGAAASPNVHGAMAVSLRSLLDWAHMAGYQPVELADSLLGMVLRTLVWLLQDVANSKRVGEWPAGGVAAG